MTKGTNTNPVLDAFREDFDSYDAFSSALNAQFDIAECLFRYGVEVPASWEFSPGLAAGHSLNTEDASFFAVVIDGMVRQGHVSNLIHAGNVLMRYVAQLKLAGRDY